MSEAYVDDPTNIPTSRNDDVTVNPITDTTASDVVITSSMKFMVLENENLIRRCADTNCSYKRAITDIISEKYGKTPASILCDLMTVMKRLALYKKQLTDVICVGAMPNIKFDCSILLLVVKIYGLGALKFNLRPKRLADWFKEDTQFMLDGSHYSYVDDCSPIKIKPDEFIEKIQDLIFSIYQEELRIDKHRHNLLTFDAFIGIDAFLKETKDLPFEKPDDLIPYLPKLQRSVYETVPVDPFAVKNVINELWPHWQKANPPKPLTVAEKVKSFYQLHLMFHNDKTDEEEQTVRTTWTKLGMNDELITECLVGRTITKKAMQFFVDMTFDTGTARLNIYTRIHRLSRSAVFSYGNVFDNKTRKDEYRYIYSTVSNCKMVAIHPDGRYSVGISYTDVDSIIFDEKIELVSHIFLQELFYCLNRSPKISYHENKPKSSIQGAFKSFSKELLCHLVHDGVMFDDPKWIDQILSWDCRDECGDVVFEEVKQKVIAVLDEIAKDKPRNDTLLEQIKGNTVLEELANEIPQIKEHIAKIRLKMAYEKVNKLSYHVTDKNVDAFLEAVTFTDLDGNYLVHRRAIINFIGEVIKCGTIEQFKLLNCSSSLTDQLKNITISPDHIYKCLEKRSKKFFCVADMKPMCEAIAEMMEKVGYARRLLDVIRTFGL